MLHSFLQKHIYKYSSCRREQTKGKLRNARGNQGHRMGRSDLGYHMTIVWTSFCKNTDRGIVTTSIRNIYIWAEYTIRTGNRAMWNTLFPKIDKSHTPIQFCVEQETDIFCPGNRVHLTCLYFSTMYQLYFTFFYQTCKGTNFSCRLSIRNSFYPAWDILLTGICNEID
jgi:hypothetical protein